MDTTDSEFRKALEDLINYHSKEGGSDTPDFILADYLIDCLAAFDRAVERREHWNHRQLRREQTHEIKPEK